ncbi:GNAT family N-acetyltransferase [Primorskyibacter aestuariivivens]|uniref:GNAT family N-acetyltransferase n=1 Tax=Primorskyibacter aestuariivivens TaxID=1888912 RepID=UPI002301E6F1|nr:GNAT family N-acetyltransferase [Primorskyibacter aestuariivivens]MDA7428766.1 GNAT family N-acetyltransferase [Primorskyibacter aestuariivivens]
MTRTIRDLDAITDLDLVRAFYAEAPDYWLLAEGQAPDESKIRGFFTDGPPGCDPAASHRLGLFLDGRLSGLAELSFGFPEPGDAYLGLMILGPWAQGAGHGRAFLAHAEGLARARGAAALYLAVFEANSGGRAFWEREGFAATGVSGRNEHHVLHRLVKHL